MSREFELKLALPVRAAAAFRADPTLVRLGLGPVSSRRLYAIYFDTAARHLSRAGVALRVRRVGRQWIQTIKIPEPVGSASVHEELERPVAAGIPDLGAAELRALKRAIGGAFDPGDILPVFETRMRRTTWPLRLIDTDIELVYDAGRITAGAQSERVSEVELELKNGNPGRLFELAGTLLENHPLRIEPRTKAARGFALADASEPSPVVTAAVQIDSGMSVRDALAVTAESCLALYNANTLVLRAGEDPEGVHQMRVALRRLRALVSACSAALAPDARAFLTEELRWLQQQLGPARDWDVFIAETLEPMLHRLPNDRDLPVLREAAGRRRAEGYRQARVAIDDPHHTRILLRIGGWLATGDWVQESLAIGLAEFAAERLQERHRKLRKFGKAADLPLEELHRLRIASKKLRYVAEFFRPVYSKRASKPYLAALKDLQDDLGSINDAIVTERLMDEIEPQVVRRIGRIRAARARSLLTGWQAQRVERDLARFRAVWERFRDSDAFWPKPPRRGVPRPGDNGSDATLAAAAAEPSDAG